MQGNPENQEIIFFSHQLVFLLWSIEVSAYSQKIQYDVEDI